MRIKTVKLIGFKRFDDLTIDLGDASAHTTVKCNSIFAICFLFHCDW